MRSNFYAQANTTLLVNGINVGGLAEGDCIRIKADGGAAIRTKGADGPSLSISSFQGGTLEFDLKPTSPALGIMYALWQSQQSLGGAVGPFAIIVMTGVQEVIAAVGMFGDLPQFSTGGPQMQPRKFMLECTALKLDLSSVESIAGGSVAAALA